MTFSLRVAVTSLIVTTMLPACALRSFPNYEAVVHPLDPPKPNTVESNSASSATGLSSGKTADKSLSIPTPKTGATYGEGLAYLRGVEKLWEQYTRARGAFSENIGKVLIPITGAGIGLAAAGVSGNPMIGLGAAAGTALGVGALVQNRPRVAVYRLGIAALQCVRRKTAPFDVAEDVRKDVMDKLIKLRERVLELAGATDTVRDLLDLDTNKLFESQSSYVNAKASIQSADAVQAAAQQTIKQGLALDHSVRRVGRVVIDAVDDIKTTVDTAALDTVVDISSLSGVLGQIRFPGQTVFGGLATPTKLPEKPAVPPPVQSQQDDNLKTFETKLGQPLRKMEELMKEVASRNEEVAMMLETVNIQTLPGLQDCLDQNEAKRLASEIRIHESPDVAVKQGATATIVVTGGTGSYSVTPLAAASEQLEVKADQITGATRIQITAKSSATAGPYHLLVKDSGTGERLVNVKILPKS